MLSAKCPRHPGRRGKLLTRDDSENHSKDEIPFGAMVEHYPISARDQARLHQFGEKVLPGILLGFALIAGGIWKGDIFLVADMEELEKLDASEKYTRRLECERSHDFTEGRRIRVSCGRWYGNIVGKDITNSWKPTQRREQTVRG